jgi:hypothetical protein
MTSWMQLPLEGRVPNADHWGSDPQVCKDYDQKVEQTLFVLKSMPKLRSDTWYIKPSNLITTCTVHIHFKFPKGPPSSQAALYDQVTPSPQEYFVWHGLPSSCDANSTRIIHSTWSTRIFCSTRSILIMWCRVHMNFLLNMVHPWHVMLRPQDFFIDIIHWNFLFPYRQHSSHDARPTRIFYCKRFTLITWCQVHRNFFPQKVHPYLVTPSQQECANSILLLWMTHHAVHCFQLCLNLEIRQWHGEWSAICENCHTCRNNQSQCSRTHWSIKGALIRWDYKSCQSNCVTAIY